MIVSNQLVIITIIVMLLSLQDLEITFFVAYLVSHCRAKACRFSFQTSLSCFLSLATLTLQLLPAATAMIFLRRPIRGDLCSSLGVLLGDVSTPLLLQIGCFFSNIPYLSYKITLCHTYYRKLNQQHL